jgi:DNA-binding FadR family transcriptional regulator
MFEPIAQTPRYRLVAEAIAAKITEGSFPTGEKLPPDRVLVEELGVSRATLREALIALEVKGYIETRYGAGAYVLGAPEAEGVADADQQLATLVPVAPVPGPFEALEARRLIEGELAALAAQAITPVQLDTLWGSLQALETAPSGWDAAADARFHDVIATAAGNAVLAHLAAQFWRDQTENPLWAAIQRAVDDSNTRPQLVAEHEAIIEALTEGDPEAARAAMHAHLDSFARTLLAQWDTPETGSAEAAPHARLRDSLRDAG